MASRRIVLCADDYGLSPGVGKAIRDLIARGRLSATGCMTLSPYWPAEAILLRELSGNADIGLHLTLTDQPPLTPMPHTAPGGVLPPLGRLMAKALLRQLDPGEITAELERQWEAFEAAMGCPPAFIDGHHHIHQLPQIRDIVADVRTRRSPQAWVRYCDEPLPALRRIKIAVPRAAVISVLGRGFRKLGRAQGLPGNNGFRGVRNFDEKSFAALMPRWLAGAGSDSLIMCHPGLVDEALIRADSLTLPREDEYRYMAGNAFEHDLAAAGVELGKLS